MKERKKKVKTIFKEICIDSSKNAVLSGSGQGAGAQILSQKTLNLNPDSANLVPCGLNFIKLQLSFL